MIFYLSTLPLIRFFTGVTQGNSVKRSQQSIPYPTDFVVSYSILYWIIFFCTLGTWTIIQWGKGPFVSVNYSIRSYLLTSSWYIYRLGHNTTLFLTKHAYALNLGWTLWSGIITSSKLFPLKVQLYGVAIKTGGLLCCRKFGYMRVLHAWGIILSDMG